MPQFPGEKELLAGAAKEAPAAFDWLGTIAKSTKVGRATIADATKLGEKAVQEVEKIAPIESKAAASVRAEAAEKVTAEGTAKGAGLGAKLRSISKRLIGGAALTGTIYEGGKALLGSMGSGKSGASPTRNPGSTTPDGNKAKPRWAPKGIGDNGIVAPSSVDDIGLASIVPPDDNIGNGRSDNRGNIIAILRQILAEEKRTTVTLSRGFSATVSSLNSMNDAQQRSQVLSRLAIDASNGESNGRRGLMGLVTGSGRGNKGEGSALGGIAKGLLLAAGVGAALGVIKSIGNDDETPPGAKAQIDSKTGKTVINPKTGKSILIDPKTGKPYKQLSDVHVIDTDTGGPMDFHLPASVDNRFFGDSQGQSATDVAATAARNKYVGRSALASVAAALPIQNKYSAKIANSHGFLSHVADWTARQIPMSNSARQHIATNEEHNENSNMLSSKQVAANKGIAMDFFQKNGWSQNQAAGIVANLIEESQLNPNENTGDGGTAYGIAQWHAPRQRDFANVMHKPIQGSTFMEQLEFVQSELSTYGGGRVYKDLKSATTASDAAGIVSSEYEQPAAKDDAMQKRGMLADQLLAGINGSFAHITGGADTTGFKRSVTTVAATPANIAPPSLAPVNGSNASATPVVSSMSSSNHSTNVKNNTNVTMPRGNAVADAHLRSNVVPGSS